MKPSPQRQLFNDILNAPTGKPCRGIRFIVDPEESSSWPAPGTSTSAKTAK